MKKQICALYLFVAFLNNISRMPMRVDIISFEDKMYTSHTNMTDSIKDYPEHPEMPDIQEPHYEDEIGILEWQLRTAMQQMDHCIDSNTGYLSVAFVQTIQDHEKQVHTCFSQLRKHLDVWKEISWYIQKNRMHHTVICNKTITLMIGPQLLPGEVYFQKIRQDVLNHFNRISEMIRKQIFHTAVYIRRLYAEKIDLYQELLEQYHILNSRKALLEESHSSEALSEFYRSDVVNFLAKFIPEKNLVDEMYKDHFYQIQDYLDSKVHSLFHEVAAFSAWYSIQSPVLSRQFLLKFVQIFESVKTNDPIFSLLYIPS